MQCSSQGCGVDIVTACYSMLAIDHEHIQLTVRPLCIGMHH